LNTFIRAFEYWVPSADASMLEFGGGLYGSATRFESISRELCFGRGEGLPGQAWEAGHPIVLKQFEGSYFRRIAAARAEGITCGIALPIFGPDRLNAVLVIFCGDDAENGTAHAGAIELWKNDPAESRDLTLVEGYYGHTGDTFEFISKSVAFRRGTGLPGMAWEAEAPLFLDDLGRGSGFLREDSAIKVGINRGFAMPCSTSGSEHYVMAFLSALATPIARRVEIWQPDARCERLRRTAGFSEIEGSLAAIASGVGSGLGRGEGPIGVAFASGIPALAESASAGADSGPLAAIPVMLQGRLSAVLALYL
jgi:hypothetical protein